MPRNINCIYRTGRSNCKLDPIVTRRFFIFKSLRYKTCCLFVHLDSTCKNQAYWPKPAPAPPAPPTKSANVTDALAREMFEDWKKNHVPEFLREQLDALKVEFIKDFRLIDPIWAERIKYKKALEEIKAIDGIHELPYTIAETALKESD